MSALDAALSTVERISRQKAELFFALDRIANDGLTLDECVLIARGALDQTLNKGSQTPPDAL